MTRALLAMLGSVLLALPASDSALAQGPAPPQVGMPPGKKDASAGETATRDETLVVTATRVETPLVNAPATMSVIGAETLAVTPTHNYGDLLRTVPGLNVIQFSARDIGVTSRQSTGTLAAGQLALLDGRSLYHDFLGVLWDAVPANVEDIRQIEVLRGPASAVWGGNAAAGVINVITRPPREAVGTTVTLTGGLLNRDGGSRQSEGAGRAFGAHVSLARAPNDRLSYRLSAGYDTSAPYSRPVGHVPRGRHPLNESLATGGAEYPADQAAQLGTFENRGTRQAKVDVRVDQEIGHGGRITYDVGWAGSEGIIHTGFGPFRMQRGSHIGVASVGYTKGRLKIDALVTLLDVRALNLLLSERRKLTVFPNVDAAALNLLRSDPDRPSFEADFKTRTYDVEISRSNRIAGRHLLTYGGQARWNHFDMSLAPSARDRNEFGTYLLEELVVDRFRVAVGGRLDRFHNLNHAVFSPRVAVMFKPTRSDAIRASFTRGFRPPSVVDNYLDQNIFAPPGLCCDLRGLVRPARVRAPDLVPLVLEPFPLVVKNVGNPNLKEETVDAYELAYTRTVGTRTTLGLAVYETVRKNEIAFTSLLPSLEHPRGLPGLDFYTPASPPPGVPAPLIVFLSQVSQDFGGPISLPHTVGTYLNLAGTRNRGLEASLEHVCTNDVSAYANGSFQATPGRLEARADQIATPTGEIGIPPRYRLNVGANLNTRRFLGHASVNFTDKAFHTDVLTPDYHSWTDAYVMVNTTFGVKWAEGKVVTSLKAINLANEKIQQHTFGDIIGRAIFTEMRLHF